MISSFIPYFGRSQLITLVLLVIPQLAHAATYSCNAVDKKALLGIDSGSVGVSGHDKICEFSVNGVSPTGKQSPDFANSMNQLLSGSFSGNSVTAEALASMVLGPFLPERPDSNFFSRFRNSFGTYVRDVAVCMASFRDEPTYSGGSRVNRDNITCRVLDPERRGYDEPASFGPVEAQVNQPTLMVGLTLDRQSYVLFIPAHLINLGKRGYRFGQ